jgi:DNA-binding response OmpR family regulator
MTTDKNGNILVVLDGRDHHGLIRSLSQWGFSTIVVDNQLKALDQIDHHNIAAAVVEDQGSVDIVEFVLSVRDAHRELPIIIIRSPKNQYVENIIGKKSDVFFVSADQDSFRPEMHAVLEASGE